MFDKVKFYQSVALLKSFKANLPEKHVAPSEVDHYHSYLSDLQEQVGIDLSKFRIPDSAIKFVGTSAIAFTSNRPTQVSGYKACDAHVFRRQLDALTLFIDTYLDDLKSNNHG